MRRWLGFALLGLFVTVAQGAAIAPEMALQQITSAEFGSLRSIAGWLRQHGRDGYVGADVADAMGIARQESEELLEARQDGSARAVGVSNYTLRQIDSLAAASGERPAVNQVRCSGGVDV